MKMNNIKLYNKIAKVGTDELPSELYNYSENVENPDAILVRSASLLDLDFNPALRAIARCGAGVNNIPIDRCSEAGIVVFNTPGANANGVKELTIAALLLASRDIVGGICWANTLSLTEDVAKAVEKGKSAFAGIEIAGKTLGVIGLGAIGGMVANTATHLGMNVLGCDPFLTVNAAWNLSRGIKKADRYEQIYKEADFITLHVPAAKDTIKMINAETIAMMKDGVRIINLSRADLVDINAVKEAIASGKVAAYITDFPTNDTIGVKGIIAIPHLGASTNESEDNCAVMASHELRDFLELGNITNSVNFPNVSLPRTGDHRICLMHKNIPAMLSKITGAVSEQGINIENLSNGSKGNYAYTILETKGRLPDSVVEGLSKMDGIIRVTVL